MAQVVRTVGVDPCKRELVARSWPCGQQLTVANDRDGWRKLSEWCSALGADRIALEATGGYEYGAAEFLSAAQHSVVLHDPRRVRRFREALSKAKNDVSDAEANARFAQVIECAPFIPDKMRLRLREWLALRQNLVDARVRLANVVEHLTVGEPQRAAERQIAALTATLATLDRRIVRLLGTEPRFAPTVRILSSAPGVGPVLTATLVALVPELGQLSRHAIARLIGVAPLDDDSGPRHGARHIAGGRKRVRRILYNGGPRGGHPA